MFAMLLPFIEAALRRNALFPAETAHVELAATAAIVETSPGVDLSQREVEIMRWVRQGKTNLEIGSILDISAFTVKNHLQRIFRKLNVGNRAQAVALLEDRARGVTSP
jgi:DNA-binding CsgD family transcriptional regulator